MRYGRAVGRSIPFIALIVCAMLSLGGWPLAAPMPAHVRPAALERILQPVTQSGSGHGVPLATMARRAVPATEAHAAGPPGSFPFQTATSADGHIVVHYYNQYAGFGADFINEAQRALSEQVVPKLGFSLNQRVDIYYYNSRNDFLAGAQPISPQITGAFSTFGPFVIYMPVFPDPADTFATLAHELTHITFHQHVNAGHLTHDYDLFPLWFEEGQAASDEPSNSPGFGAYSDSLVQNIRNGGRFMDVFSQFIWNYPQDVDTDNLAYAESRAFVNYLYSTFGATRYHQFVSDALDGNLLYAAEVDFGADLQTVQSQWEKSLGLPGVQHAAGTLPQVATPSPFTSGALPELANRTRPYGVGGGEGVLAQALAQAGLALLAVLAGLVAGTWWIRRQRRFARAREVAPPLPSYYSYPSTPTYQVGPAGEPLLVGRPLTYLETLSPVPQLPPLKIPGDLTWVERTALALTVPLVLAAGLAWALVDPSLSWRHAALSAAAVALVCAVVAGVLGLRARHQGLLPVGYFVTCGVLLIGALVAGLGDAYTAGMAQGQAYEHGSAYALAAQAFADVGAPTDDRMRVQTEWAQAAYALNDYAAATAHFRAAIALKPGSSDALQDGRDLLNLTTEWNTKLIAAQRFDEAVHVIAAQLAFASCDTTCKSSLQTTGGADYLAWIQNLCAHKQASQALDKITALSSAFPGSAADASAKRALGVQSQGLVGAWAAAKAGDTVAMDLVAELVAARTSDPLQLAMASEASQPVTGSLDPVRQYKPDVHLYFVAFHSEQDANNFTASIKNRDYTDTSVFKVAAVTDAGGNITVWLPGGYTYLPLWEAPAQGNDDGYFYYSGTSFTVDPYTPLTLPRAISL